MKIITYQLLIRLSVPITVDVGRLGQCSFPAGYYCYTGSAQRNLSARVRRHLRKNKPLRWHIDYLTIHPEVEIVRIFGFIRPECRINQMTKGLIIVPGFGASDCRNHCGSHLKWIARHPLSDPPVPWSDE